MTLKAIVALATFLATSSVFGPAFAEPRNEEERCHLIPNNTESRECLARYRITRSREVARAETAIAYGERFGLSRDRDFDVDVDIAVRRRLTWALIYKRCWASAQIRDRTADELNACFAHNEKVETALGNRLDQPAK